VAGQGAAQPSLWLSHHRPRDLNRCVLLGRWYICRRCLLLWPLCYGLIAVQVGLRAPSVHALDLLLPLLLLPPVLDYVELHLGWRSYSAARTWLHSPLLALGLARLLFRYMARPLDPVTWLALAAVALPCAWAAWRHHHRNL